MWGLNRVFPAATKNNVLFEHGVFLGDVLLEAHFSNRIDTIVTMSPFRVPIIQSKTGKRAICVGAYTNYVQDEDEFTRASLVSFPGTPKVLLFSGHSVRGIRFVSDFQRSITRIRSIYRDARIYVSLFHTDFCQSQLRRSIEDNGAIPICFGDRYDPDFLVRLKTAISTVDSVVTDNIGTHVGYSLSLGKVPFYMSTGSKQVVEDRARADQIRNLYVDYSSRDRQIEFTVGCLPKLGTTDSSGCFDEDVNRKLNKIFGHDIALSSLSHTI